jgi:hypothetical protein
MNVDPTSPRTGLGRPFYSYVSILAGVVVFAGFSRTFYLKAAYHTPVLPTLLHVHGVVMTLWFAVFILQVRLVAMNRSDLHRPVGVIAALVAALVVVVGTATAIAAAKRGYVPDIPGTPLPPLVFLVVPLADLLVFTGLVTTALVLRRRPDIHRRLMPLAALSLLTPAISRIPLGIIHSGGIALYLALTVLFVLACVVVDTVKSRRLHPAFGWGAATLILSEPLRMLVGSTSAWMRFATWLIA